jgi:hypothetical protein
VGKSMPIEPYLGDRVFGPELLDPMNEAFGIICNHLNLNASKDDPATRRVAEAVIEAAQAGECEVMGLMDAAFKRLGLGNPLEPAA